MNEAELIIKLKAQVEDAKKKLDQVNGQLKKMGGEGDKSTKQLGAGFKNLTSSILPVIGVATGAALALRKIYDIGREGAELEYAAKKFDRLTEAIGSTSDALLEDLREATKGTRSDMELMAAAGDFLALGLAKSHDQVVRLTRVAGALNMDMNQLVLTLANKTTMRFDQLGVSVDGFDEKVKKLEATGMDVNAVFTEAFLQQAEEQVKKVGDAADESIGAFKRFEAQLNNNLDQLKGASAGPMADFMNGMMDINEATGAGNTSWLNAIPALKGLETVILGLTYALGDHEDETYNVALTYGYYANSSMDMSERLRNVIPSVRELTDAEREALAATQGWTEKTYEAYRGISDLGSGSINAMDSINGVKDAMDDLKTATKNYLDQSGNEIADLLAQKLGPESQRYRDVLDEIDQVYGTSLQKEQEHKDKLKAIMDEYARTGDQEAFKQNLQSLRDSELPGVTTELENAAAEAQRVYDNLMKLPETLTVDVYINEHGGVEIETTTVGRGNIVSTPGGRGEQEGFATGGSYVIPPGYYESWPVGPGMYGSSGEVVEIHPTGQGGGGQQINVTVQANVNGDVDYYKMGYVVADIIKRSSQWHTS